MVRVLIVISLVGAVSCVGEQSVKEDGRCARIVSLAPSITEVLFELNLGSRIVGVTRYCTWPPETAAIAKVGGWYDPSAEAIVALKPDTLFYLPEQEAVAARVREAGVTTVALPARHLDDVTAAARLIGSHCHAEVAAAKFTERFTRDISSVTMRADTGARPRVLLVVGRTPDSGPVGALFVAGKGSFHDEIVTAAGGTNACSLTLPYPRVSVEGVIAMQPDIIIELTTRDASPFSREDWERFASLPAVRKGRIYRLTDDRFFIPGPRAPLLVAELARLINRSEGQTP